MPFTPALFFFIHKERISLLNSQSQNRRYILTKIGEIFYQVLLFMNTCPQSVSVSVPVSMYCLNLNAKQEIVCFKGESCNQITSPVL